MKKSHYFAELFESYQSEIDDLRYDSEGKNVLKSRLALKRSVFSDLMPMIACSPEMVVSAFHGSMESHNPKLMQQLILGSPEGELLAWAAVAPHVSFTPEMAPFVQIALKAPGGDEFMVIAAGLLYLSTSHSADSVAQDANVAVEADASPENAEGDEDEDFDGDAPRGEDWLSDQGFDRRSPE